MLFRDAGRLKSLPKRRVFDDVFLLLGFPPQKSKKQRPSSDPWIEPPFVGGPRYLPPFHPVQAHRGGTVLELPTM